MPRRKDKLMKRISHLQALAALTVLAIVLCVSLIALASSPKPALAGNLTSSSGSYPSQNVSRTVTLKNLRVGLDKLKSYRVRSSWSFDGKLANGKPYTQSYTIVESAFPSDKKFYRVVTLTQTPQMPSDAPSLTLESFEIAGVTYVSSTFGAQKATCESLPMPGGLSGGGGLFGPAGDAQSVRGARLIKAGDRVNGILADQYALDAKSLFTSGIKSASGNIWVARDGGYVVKLTFQATADGSILGQEMPSTSQGDRGKLTEGKLTLEYVVLGVNKEKPITLPPTCTPPKPVAADIPLPKSAANTFTQNGMTVFQSDEKVEALIAFYEKEMPAKGWKVDDETLSIGDVTLMFFTKNNRRVTISITSNPVGKGLFVLIDEK